MIHPVKSILYTTGLIFSLCACSSARTGQVHSTQASYESDHSTLAFLKKAESRATPKGRRILQTGRKMTLDNQEIIRGSCWDYANAVYNRSGFPNNRKKRKIVFKSRKRGPYADVTKIQPGDFLYYVNHSYGNIEHSAIFVNWINYARKQALMLSYGGEKRNKPARYLTYNLSSVYRIIRPAN